MRHSMTTLITLLATAVVTVSSALPATAQTKVYITRDADGNPVDYDIRAQTHSVINNVRVILEAHGSSLDDVVDVLVFLVDMERDFPVYNEVYSHYFAEVLPARTTVAVEALPTAIAIELKVIAKA